MLVGVIVACFLILLALSVAAPAVAHELRRERELEAVHRGNQYVRAIQLYYRKFGHYPSSIDQLEKSNNIRFLRQKYVDPMTGKEDWRLIHMGEAKTTAKGFFGQPLAGLPTAGLGSAAGMASSMGGSGTGGGSTSGSGSGGFGAGAAGGTGTTGTSGAMGASGSGTSGFGGTSSGPGASSMGSGSSGSSSNSSSTSATSFTGSGGLIMGVGISKTGDSILELNEQTTYPTWEFIYDPRVEALKAKAALLSGGPASSSTSSFGSSPGTTTPGTTPPGTPPGTGTQGGSTPQ
jgi:type II secretory pathway pseudopilin PulG